MNTLRVIGGKQSVGYVIASVAKQSNGSPTKGR